MNKKLTILSIITASVLFTACGGGGGGSSSSSNNSNSAKSISGNVVDGPIEGASVSVQCQRGSYGPVFTDKDGAFTITNINSNINLSTCTIYAKGGNDGINDFTNLTLKAPYSLAKTNIGINVTPITTLVANHNGTIEEAQREIADFLEISTDKLKENPNAQGNTELLKKAISLTKIAQIQGSFIDVDGINNDNSGHIKANKLSGYITSDLTTLSTQEKEELEETLKAINDATNKSDMEKNTLLKNVLHLLKNAYKITSFAEKDEEKANLEYLSEQIIKANKKNDKYRIITKNHIRKALSDIGLTPSFTDKNKTTLKTSISTTLALTKSDFESFIKGTTENPKTIDIANIKGLILFDADSYKQIVGDDQEKRRNYYAFSNKSNISNLLNLVNSDNYNDSVNDNISKYVALGLGKLGLYEDAIKYVDDNVLTEKEQDLAYYNLGLDFNTYKENSYASQALQKDFKIIEERIIKKGIDKADYFVGRDLNSITNNMIKANNQKLAEEAINFANTVAKASNNAYIGRNAEIGLESLAFKTYYANNDLTKAQYFAKKAAEEAINIPNSYFNNPNYNFAIEAQLDSAITASFFKQNSAATDAIAKVNENKSKYTNSDTLNYKLFVYNSFNDEINTVITNFSNSLILPTSKQDDALMEGFASRLVAEGKSDKLFEYYDDTNIFKEKSAVANMITLETINVGGTDRVGHISGIKLLSDEDTLKTYLNRMYNLIKSWTISKEDEKALIYSTWGNTNRGIKGYLALAQLYKDLNEEAKTEEIINDAYVKIDTIKDVSTRINAFKNLINASIELGINNKSDRENMLTTIETAAKASSNITEIIDAANFLSKHNKKSNAEKLIEKAYSLLEDLGSTPSYEKVEKRVNYLIGKKASWSKRRYYAFKDSIANAYYQANNIDKAKEIIAEAYENISTQDTSSTNVSSLIARVVDSYASLNDIKNAKKHLPEVGTKKDIDDTIIAVAEGLYEFDAFLDHDIASIDSDNDGNPDFFLPNVTDEQIAASGLTLDDDIDEDGIADTLDNLPYDKI